MNERAHIHMHTNTGQQQECVRRSIHIHMHTNTGQQQECVRRSRGRHVSMSAFASLICSSVFTLIPAILPLYSSSSSSSRYKFSEVCYTVFLYAKGSGELTFEDFYLLLQLCVNRQSQDEVLGC